MPIEDTINAISVSAGLAISIEPTGWGVAGNVSRNSDQTDKKLQDFIVAGHIIQQKLYELLKKKLSLEHFFSELYDSLNDILGTNTSFGALTLLVPNIIASVETKSTDINLIAEKAYSLIIKEEASWFFHNLEKLSSSFIHPYTSTLIPTLKDHMNPRWRSRTNKRLLTDYLRLINYDPVSMEIVSVFTTTRRMASKLSSNYGISLSSEIIDKLFRYYCCRFIDYLVYRRCGLERALECRNACCEGELTPRLTCSMGSISDLITLTLYYHFYTHFTNQRSTGFK